MAKVIGNINEAGIEELYHNVKSIIKEARDKIYRSANFAMVESYWHIGKLIVEEEQKGEQRAEYGKEVIKRLAIRLIISSEKGFNERNLWYIKQFYQTWPILNALRSELSWTHYRLLLKIEQVDVRTFYIEETAKCGWSTRTLERQINSLYYERMVMTPVQNKGAVKKELEEVKEEMQAIDIIKDPYVLEFLGLKSNVSFYEKDFEQAIIDKLQDFLLELGRGFSFVGRQYRLSVGTGKNFYVDLVFYNYILKCFLI